MSKIAFCIITKGDLELESLKTCIASVENYVDSIHIQTNHKEHSKTHSWAKKKGFDIVHRPWTESFAEARNANFAQAPKDVDYIFWLDSDDVLVGGEHLRETVDIAKKNGHMAVFFTYWYGCKFNGKPSLETLTDIEITQNRERLLKPGVLTWKNRLHETPVEKPGIDYRYTSFEYDKIKNPIAVLHLGASRDQDIEAMQARLSRNQRLLELQLLDEIKEREGGADPRTLLYLMKIYAESDHEEHLRKCIDYGEEYLTKSGWDEERALSYQIMGKCYGLLGEYQTAAKCFLSAIAEFPHDTLNYLYMARSCFNLGKYKAGKKYLDIALTVKEEVKVQMDNDLEKQLVGAELLLRYFTEYKKSVREAYKVSKKIFDLIPSEENKVNMDHLKGLSDLDKACEWTHRLVLYMHDTNQQKLIPTFLDSLPKKITQQKFATTLKHKFSPARIWGNNEICYFANFGGPHFEYWTPESLNKGIGGSETAVIKLSKLWTQMGYRVTVYGDPGPKEGEYDGVTYLPWFDFNIKDKFNVFIQWRSSSLAEKVSAKKFYVDLHDIYAPEAFENLQPIDKIFVKSNYHRQLAKDFPDEKFKIISNGIEV